MNLMCTVERRSDFGWISAESAKAMLPVRKGRRVSVDIIVTHEYEFILADHDESDAIVKFGSGIEISSVHPVDNVLCYHGSRPEPTRLSPASLAVSGTVAVITCGPVSVNIDVADACSAMQCVVLADGVEQIVLQTESFN